MQRAAVTASDGVVPVISVRNEAVVVGAVRRLSPGASQQVDDRGAEELDEEPAELLSESDVHDEVDGGVYGDEEVARLDQFVVELAVEGLDDVVDEGEEVAQEEDYDDADEHRRQADLLLLQAGEAHSLVVCLPHLRRKFGSGEGGPEGPWGGAGERHVPAGRWRRSAPRDT